MAETRLCAPGLSLAGWLVFIADAAREGARQGGAHA